MKSYHALASCYDRLTWDVDYPAVVAFYRRLLALDGLTPRTALDLACGTGSVALLLADMGLRVTGVDQSEEMLTMAAQKAQDHPNPPYFAFQRLQDLHVPQAADLAVCALDSLDYLTEPEDCRRAIRRVYKALNPGGCFLFDVNTPEKLRAMDGQIFLDEDEEVFCIWRGEFDEKSMICSYGMDIFRREGRLWRRDFEEHREYAYSRAQLTAYLREAGFRNIRVFGDRRLEPPRPGEQRIYFMARKGNFR